MKRIKEFLYWFIDVVCPFLWEPDFEYGGFMYLSGHPRFAWVCTVLRWCDPEKERE